MTDILFYFGLALFAISSIALCFWRIKQYQLRDQIKDIPKRYEEWKARYAVRRWYFYIAQAAGIIIAIIGLNS